VLGVLVDELGHEPARRHDLGALATHVVERPLDERRPEPLPPAAGDDLGVAKGQGLAHGPVIGHTEEPPVLQQLVPGLLRVVENFGHAAPSAGPGWCRSGVLNVLALLSVPTSAGIDGSGVISGARVLAARRWPGRVPGRWRGHGRGVPAPPGHPRVGGGRGACGPTPGGYGPATSVRPYAGDWLRPRRSGRPPRRGPRARWPA